VNNIPRVKLDLSMLGAEVTSLSLSDKNAQVMFTPPAHIALRGPFTHKARHTSYHRRVQVQHSLKVLFWRVWSAGLNTLDSPKSVILISESSS
jgi:hypothetical protein